MCLGIPMQIIESADGYALCQSADGVRRIDTLLVGAQPSGVWLLTFLDTAREVLEEAQAARILDALRAVDHVMQGGSGVDHLFADLTEREPRLPDFLQSEPATDAKGS